MKATQQDSVATGQVATITAPNTMLHFIQNATSTIIKHTAGRNFVWLDIFIGFILHATPFYSVAAFALTIVLKSS